MARHKREYGPDLPPYLARGAAFEAELDRAYLHGMALEDAAKTERIREAEDSPAQREWEGHDDACESEFITEAGMYSPCQCKDRADEE